MSRLKNQKLDPSNKEKELTITELDAVNGGTEAIPARINQTSVNPVIISRDRALNS